MRQMQQVVLGDFATPAEAESAAKLASQISGLLGKPIEATVRYQLVGMVNGHKAETAVVPTGSTDAITSCGFCGKSDFTSVRGKNSHISQMHKKKRAKK